MYFPRLKKFKTRREKIVSELVEAMEIKVLLSTLFVGKFHFSGALG